MWLGFQGFVAFQTVWLMGLCKVKYLSDYLLVVA